MLHVVQPDKPATARQQQPLHTSNIHSTAATSAATACQLYRLTPAWKPAIVFMCHQYDVVQVQVQVQLQFASPRKIRRRSVRSDNRVGSRVEDGQEDADEGQATAMSGCPAQMASSASSVAIDPWPSVGPSL